MKNEKILIIGGSGSLGKTLITKWIDNNIIMNISRNEENQWKLTNKFNTNNLLNIIGDITNYQQFKYHIYNFNPTIIVYAAALKHIDKCEKQINTCLSVNYNGLNNIIEDILSFRDKYSNLNSFIFVSTDKACNPISVYGYSKAISETLIQNTKIENIKFCAVRYGNILNSSGSIIPLFNKIGSDNNIKNFTITDERMTRFLMYIEESVKIIEYAIENSKNNEIIVPLLKSCKISDICSIFSDYYKKDIVKGSLRCIEKYNEELISYSESAFTYMGEHPYIHISSKRQDSSINVKEFSSADNIISKSELEDYIIPFINNYKQFNLSIQ
jgi:UDP-N-acetylglucosamine 4,6-dehydratase